MDLILTAAGFWAANFAAACLIIFWQRLYRASLFFALAMHVLGVAAGTWAIVDLIIN